MTSDQRSALKAARPGIDFTDVDPRETSRAWNKFLSNRNAPSLPMTGVRSLIYQSWVRSNTTGIKPDQFAAPSLERSGMAAKSSHDQAELRRAARASMMRIGDLLSGAEAMLLLTDRDGLILEAVGDNSTLSKASKINLSVGGLWSEHASGTNGIGTALWTGQPVYVHGEEHFCEGMKAWSCAAAPIRDPIDQSIIGVVNLSGLTRIFQKHNAAFAATAARDIELVLQQEQSLLNIRLMEASIGSLPGQAMDNADGFAIIDRFGRLIFSRNSGVNIGRPDQELGLGAHFLELPDGISEAKIAAALPSAHCCNDIRLIEIDGMIKGAALAFRQSPNASHPAPMRQPSTPALPGVLIGTTGLKIVGESEAILQALDTAKRIASANEPTLIEGQTGVGKELFARLIHSRLSPESGRCFRTVNCGAMTPKMFGDALLHPLEAEGTEPLCLDEIGETSAETQLYLLRILEEHSACLNGPHPPAQSLRVLSLTNRAMRDEVEAGRFRRDLFYRLSTVVLTIPPLHARGEDVLLIAEHYIRKISMETGRDRLQLAPEVQDALMAHVWPGNVRELRNLVSGLHVLAKSRMVTLADLPPEITTPTLPNAGLIDPADAQDQLLPIGASLKHAEIRLIENALKHHHGNLSKAAIALGISRPTLYRKIEAYGIRAS
ncbi:MAG: sigma 54-interacting transcriptional regulator [Cypionkella sp.]|nr:sigma 54-interacting transcriptional regulator [Cypionkella sp.]